MYNFRKMSQEQSDFLEIVLAGFWNCIPYVTNKVMRKIFPWRINFSNLFPLSNEKFCFLFKKESLKRKSILHFTCPEEKLRKSSLEKKNISSIWKFEQNSSVTFENFVREISQICTLCVRTNILRMSFFSQTFMFSYQYCKVSIKSSNFGENFCRVVNNLFYLSNRRLWGKTVFPKKKIQILSLAEDESEAVGLSVAHFCQGVKTAFPVWRTKYWEKIFCEKLTLSNPFLFLNKNFLDLWQKVFHRVAKIAVCVFRGTYERKFVWVRKNFSIDMYFWAKLSSLLWEKLVR